MGLGVIGDRGVPAAVAWGTRIERFSDPAIQAALAALVTGAVVMQQPGQLELTFSKLAPNKMVLYIVVPGGARRAEVTIETLPTVRPAGTYDLRTVDPIPYRWLDVDTNAVELFNCHVTSILSAKS